MDQKLTEDNVYHIEHKMIHDLILWEVMDNDRLCHTTAAYICGINDMAEEIIKFLEELK